EKELLDVPSDLQPKSGPQKSSAGGAMRGGRMIGSARRRADRREQLNNAAPAPAPTAAASRSGARNERSSFGVGGDQDPNANDFAKSSGRGYRFVAIRGVFPLRAQVEELMRATGSSPGELKGAQELVQLHDFRLERQTAQPGTNPWTGPWEVVDREPVI